MQSYTRRDALRGMAVGAAGLATAGILASCAPRSIADTGTTPANGTSETDITWHGLYDVVVIGMGAAGASAAITAADEGAKVLVLEAAPDGLDGGNSHYCQQAFMSIDASDRARMLEYFKKLRGEYTYPTDEVLEAYIEGVIENEDWVKSIGGDPQPYWPAGRDEPIPIQAFEYPEFFEEGAESWMKLWTHTGAVASASTWKMLKKKVLERSDAIDVWHSAPASDLIQDAATSVIIGVVADVDGKTVNIRARNGVIIASGGFEANKEMMQGFCGVEDAHPLGGRFNTGAGIVMAANHGALLTHMHTYGGYVNSLYADGMNAEWDSGSRLGKFATSMMYVGGDGTRFTDESFASRHGYVPFHGNFVIHEICNPAWCVFDEKARTTTAFSNRYLKVGCEQALADGYVLRADTLEELAGLMDVPAENLVATVGNYNRFCEEGKDYQHGRPAQYLVPFDAQGPYYAFKMVHSVLNTQGGPMRNENAEIVDKNYEPIPHLYGAGEAGEIFSNLYQGPGNVTGCMIWGRISGRNAAAVKTEAQPAESLAIQEFAPKVEEITYDAGEGQYVGVADGMNGDVVVRVTMDGETIADVEVLSNFETSFIASPALEEMPQLFLGKTASEIVDVDGVSGATVTSEALREAVQKAVDAA